jgi:hypothetical protein
MKKFMKKIKKKFWIIIIALFVLFIVFLLFDLWKYFYVKRIYSKINENENKYLAYCVTAKTSDTNYNLEQETKYIKTENYTKNSIMIKNNGINKKMITDRWKNLKDNTEMTRITINFLNEDGSKDDSSDDLAINQIITINEESKFIGYNFFEKQTSDYKFYWLEEENLFTNIINNIWVLIKQPSIKTKELDGKECYLIKYSPLDNGTEYYIEKDTYLLLQSTDGVYDDDKVTFEYDYDFDITDEDLELPNLSEYYVTIE